MPTHLPVFLITTWLLAMLPGAGQALMVRQTLRGGPPLARPTIMGTATGLLIWSTAAAAGLSTVLLANPRIYEAIRLIGGVVLIALGIGTLRTARRTASTTAATQNPQQAGFWSAYAAGLGTNLGNPKAGVFAVSMLPQFLTARGPVLASGIALGAVWATVTACWYLLFTHLVGRGRARVSQPNVQRSLSIITGVVLVALGVAVAAGV